MPFFGWRTYLGCFTGCPPRLHGLVLQFTRRFSYPVLSACRAYPLKYYYLYLYHVNGNVTSVFKLYLLYLLFPNVT